MRRTTTRFFALTALAITLAVAISPARAQIYGGFAGSPYGYGPGVSGVNFGAVGFSPVAYGLANYAPYYGSPAYGMPSYGVGVGYGGYGFGNAYGFGYGVGGGYGWGGYPWMGTSLADQWTAKYQGYALNAARYNMMNAQATTAYQAANLLHQQALQTMLENYGGGKYPANPRAGGPTSYDRYGDGGGRTEAAGQPQGDIPFSELVARDGQVLWPLAAPEDGDLGEKKQRATQAIQNLVRNFGEDRNVAVRDVVLARRALSDYAVPAADEIRDARPDDYDSWVNYVSSLDRGLRSLAGLEGAEPGRPRTGERGEGRVTPSPAESIRVETRPDDAPKTAGDVLKEQVKTEGGETPKGETPKGEAPKPEGPRR